MQDEEENSAKPKSKYMREYYRKNKERIAEAKKRRYENDPEYREEIKQRRKMQYEKQKVARAKKKLKSGSPGNGPKEMNVLTESGRTVRAKMFLRGQLAERMELSARTLQKWEVEGVLPECAYRTKAGWRLYTEDQVEVAVRVYQKHLPDNPGMWRITDDFVRDLHNEWAALNEGFASNRGEENE